MNEVKKSVIVPFTPEEMFNLVNDINNYPKYLPWCRNAKIVKEQDNQVTGTIYIEYLKMRTHFTTINTNTKFSNITFKLVEGPFTSFSGHWSFLPLGDNGCKVEFILRYKFANIVLEKLIGPVFNYINKNIIECFVKEAAKNNTKT
jgi:ribosome-associated toxin RatA of RatAB toxin-antitoxin module